ncbi:hypothetical protein AB1Y20_020052 [Prymnesium parvum]|uniref:Uncharacterized protein n=1 Tax=Prymnesium parvum TaxID=97485 RepID=A0AB34JWG6_PRYPA
MACENADWWTAPVIVGGSGGSGTRGVVLLLEQLGVRMACIEGPRPSLFDPAICNMTCNSAADCKFLSSFRTPTPYALSFLHTNHSRGAEVHRRCGADAPLLQLASNTPIKLNGCGGSKAAAIRLMRKAVRPQYRRPLRWGMKNPHATYYANVLRQLFPCMVMVNTVRDLPDMAGGMKHFHSRVQEARSLGYLSQDEATRILNVPMLAPAHSSKQRVVHQLLKDTTATKTASSGGRQQSTEPARDGNHAELHQTFFVKFIRHVNIALDRWFQSCAPGTLAHLPLQRAVALSRKTPDCLTTSVRRLVDLLHLNQTEAMAAARAFAEESYSLVEHSIHEGQAKPVMIAPFVNITWPSNLQPFACQGPLS